MLLPILSRARSLSSGSGTRRLDYAVITRPIPLGAISAFEAVGSLKHDNGCDSMGNISNLSPCNSSIIGITVNTQRTFKSYSHRELVSWSIGPTNTGQGPDDITEKLTNCFSQLTDRPYQLSFCINLRMYII